MVFIHYFFLFFFFAFLVFYVFWFYFWYLHPLGGALGVAAAVDCTARMSCLPFSSRLTQRSTSHSHHRKKAKKNHKKACQFFRGCWGAGGGWMLGGWLTGWPEKCNGFQSRSETVSRRLQGLCFQEASRSVRMDYLIKLRKMYRFFIYLL